MSIDTDLWAPADTAPVADFERMPPPTSTPKCPYSAG